MKQKLTVLSLEQLAKEMPILSEQEQCSYWGGGTGTWEDPYSYEEYQKLVQSGSWSGGYVMGSEEHYRRDASGNWVVSKVDDAWYIPEDTTLLKEVVVVGKYPEHSEHPELTGVFTPDDPYQPKEDISGFFYSDPSDAGSEEDHNVIVPLGGGYASLKNQSTDTYSTVSSWLKKSFIRLSKDGSTAGTNLTNVLQTLSKSESFQHFLLRVKTSGYYIDISASALKSTEPGTARAGETDHTSLNKAISVRISSNMLEKNHGIGVASTIIHELVHARLYGAFAAFGIDKDSWNQKGTESYNNLRSDAFKEAYPGLYDYYTRNDGDGNGNTAKNSAQIHHEMIATHYRKMILDALREAYPGEREEVYEALSWSGLRDTEAWKKLDDPVRKKYTNIISERKS